MSPLLNSNAKRTRCLLINDKIVEEDEETSKDKLSTSKFSDNCTNPIGGFSRTLGTSVASSNHGSSEQKVMLKCDNHPASANDDKFATDMKMPDEKEMLKDKPQEDMLFKMPLLPLQRRRPSKLTHVIFF